MSRIIKNLLFSLVFIYGFSCYGSDYEEWLKLEQSSYQNFKDNFEKEFQAYKKAHDEAFEEYKEAISKKWPTPDVSDKFKYVEYTANYDEKKVVDYENENISLEVIAKTKEEAKEKIAKMFDDIYQTDVKTAYEKDIVEQKIAQKLNQTITPPKSNKQLIADIISREQQAKIKSQIKKEDLKVVAFKGERIYKANIKFPPNSMIKKAKGFTSDVNKQSVNTKMPKELIYAIIHSESSFNPMAKSYVPAFGLMQIVPRTAGVDTYKFLYGEKKLLSSRYLYESDNNILIGSNYLHILYFRYLKKIKDPQSRIYCTIAAYNTGAGNVAKAFIGSTNIYKAADVINGMSSDEVYKTLMKKLPYNETKKYLIKVTNRMDSYGKLIEKGDM